MIGSKRWAVFVVVGMAVFTWTGCKAEHERPAPPEVSIKVSPPLPPVGKEGESSAKAVAMPAYQATALDGKSISLSGKSDKVRLVNIWATWCGPCRHEIPDLIKLQSEHGKDGLEIVGVSIDDQGMGDEVRKFVKEQKINYPIALDPDGRIADLLSTSAIPTSALVDRDGNIVWMHKGMISASDDGFQALLRKTLAAKS